MDMKLLGVAAGQAPADTVITGGRIVNVYTGEIYDGGVAVCGGTIVAVGDVDYCIGEGTEVVDAGGNYITPGFIDAHIHPESSDLSIRPFAEAVLKHGTTSIMTDLHEVGVVSGLEGIEAIIEENEITDLNLYFVVPSHVPFSPMLETSGGVFNAEIIKEALKREDAIGISEVVGHYILAGFPDLMESLDAVKASGQIAAGHLPDMKGPAMNACLAAGVSNDHEALDGAEIVERMRGGCCAMLRESSAARTLADQVKYVVESGVDTTYASIVSDDLHCIDLAKTGHMDHHIKVALEAGLPFVKAIQMVTLNAARAFELERSIGGLAPGKRADINIVSGDTAETFEVKATWAAGKPVMQDGELLVHYPVAEHKPCVLNTCTLLNPITPDSFKIAAPEGASKVKVKCMDTLPWIPITQPREVELACVDGYVACDVSQDVLYIAQVERYGKNGNVGKAFMGGFHLASGAVASTVGHDNHNIIVMGTNFEDMAFAVNHLVEIQGGQCFVENGAVVKDIPYPVCGLLSDLSCDELAAEKDELNAVLAQRGCIIPITCMFLSFICLAALPTLAITDHGFINVLTMSIEDPILGVVE